MPEAERRPAVTTLTDFLEARFREDQEAAELMAKYYPPPWDVFDRGWMARVYGEEPFWEVTRLEQGSWIDNDSPPLGAIIEHVARHDPARVLREVSTKRAILADIVPAMNGADQQINSEWGVGPMDPSDYESVALLRLLALPYSDHPDFDPDWIEIDNDSSADVGK